MLVPHALITLPSFPAVTLLTDKHSAELREQTEQMPMAPPNKPFFSEQQGFWVWFVLNPCLNGHLTHWPSSVVHSLKAADHKGWFSLEASFFGILPTKSNGRHKTVECSYEQIPSSYRNSFLHLLYSLSFFSFCSIVLEMQRLQPQTIPINCGTPHL